MNQIPVIDLTATGINITRLRIRAGLTVKDVQDVFGFATPQAIYKWQHGTALPTVDNLAILAVLFGVKIDDILIFQNNASVRISA
jgi:transcriptional regulator with XRE-family HTH domain